MFMFIYRAFCAPVNVKYVADGLNSREKCMLKLEIAKILNTGLICDDPNF